MVLEQNSFFHVGIVVRDFDATVERLTRQRGLTWSPVVHVELSVWTCDWGVRTIMPRAAYSTVEPCIEVIQEIPNTPMVSLPGHPLHHLGYWTNDLERESRRLEDAGCPKVMCPIHDGKMFGVAYHEAADGLLIELVDRSSFSDWPAFLAGRMQHRVILPEAR